MYPRLLRATCRLLPVLFLGSLCNTAGTTNRPPTVVIIDGPNYVVPTDSVSFTWLGSDADGNLAGYYFWADDSATRTWTGDTAVTLRGVAFGSHGFYVQAVDDSGAKSVAAVRSFRIEYDSAVTPRGTDTTFDIATWNIENFPKDGETTVNKLRAVVARLDLDLVCVQEIADTQAFTRFVDGLAGYSGLHSDDDYGNSYQKTGVVYKSDVVTVSDVHQLFWHNDSVARPPLEMRVTASHNGSDFDFTLIVLHLKAGSGTEDRAERVATCRLLKEHIDEALEAGGERDFIVAGDWNDQLDDPPEYNVFQVFLDDTLDYYYLTWPMRSSSYNASYIGGSLIDHLMVTTDALDEYAGGSTTTLRLDDEVSGYETVISDHRPVLAMFPVFGGR